MIASKPHPMSGVDSLSPAEVAGLVDQRGVAKAKASTQTTFVLGVLAGAFIALGAVLSTVVATESPSVTVQRDCSPVSFSPSASSWWSSGARSCSPGTTSSR